MNTAPWDSPDGIPDDNIDPDNGPCDHDFEIDD